MFYLVLDMQFDHDPRLLKRQHATIERETMRGMATDWHAYIVERHFTPNNSARYRHDRRSAWYRANRKRVAGRGQGRYVDNVFSGKSRRYAMNFATITATRNRATVRMSLPAYYTKPKRGTFRNRRGQLKRITRQPDKVRELLTVPRSDDEWLTKRASDRYTAAVNKLI